MNKDMLLSKISDLALEVKEFDVSFHLDIDKNFDNKIKSDVLSFVRQYQVFCANISTYSLRLFPESKLQQLHEVLEKLSNALRERPVNGKVLFDKISEIHESSFDVLSMLAISLDFLRFDQEKQGYKESYDKVLNECEKILQEIRRSAAEQKVTNAGSFFHDEAMSHKKSSETWLFVTISLAIFIVVLVFGSLALYKVPFIRQETNADIIQLVSSKVLIFAILGSMLLLAGRSYVANKHNEIVNTHRRNALNSYRALVEASSSSPECQNIILTHAAACMYAPQETGFTPGKIDVQSGAKSVLELMTKTSKPGA